MTDSSIPDGYRRDRNGSLVPEAKIKPIDKTRDALVRELHAEASDLNRRLVAFKRRAFGDIQAFIDLSAEQYGARLGGKKGNVTLPTFDGDLLIRRQVQETIAFDERLQAAKALIDECLVEWTEGARSEVQAIIQDAFRVDREGNIRTAQVLGLRRLDIDDPRWLRAMDAVSDAVQVVGSRDYVRFYRRDAQGNYQAVVLDLAAVGVQ
jgi:hypothetical protein